MRSKLLMMLVLLFSPPFTGNYPSSVMISFINSEHCISNASIEEVDTWIIDPSTAVRNVSQIFFNVMFYLNLIASENKIECGLQQSARAKTRRKNLNKEQSAEIVGGRGARTGDYPWQISLLYKGEQHCGGAIISSYWVLTAAHCFAFRGPKEVRTGGQYWYSGTSYKVVSERLHPGYDADNIKHDVALVKVARPIKFSVGNSAGLGAVWPVCLPPSGFEISGWVIATGWGAVKESGPKSEKLKAVLLSILPSKSCRRYMYFKPELQICAGFDKGGKDTCQGDSGGPLVKIVNNQAYLVGIVSNGNGCARPGYPGIYTNVSAYLPWIFSVISDKPQKLQKS